MTEIDNDKIDKLLKDLDNRDYHVRYKAVDKLGKIKDPRAVNALLNCLADDNIDDPDCKVNFHAAATLRMMGGYSLIPSINSLKKNPSFKKDDWRRYWVARSLGLRLDKRVIDPLITVLKNEENDKVIEGVVEALENIDDNIGLGNVKDMVLRIVKGLYERRYKSKELYLSKLIKRLIDEWSGIDKLELDVKIGKIEIKKMRTNFVNGMSVIDIIKEIIKTNPLLGPMDIVYCFMYAYGLSQEKLHFLGGWVLDADNELSNQDVERILKPLVEESYKKGLWKED